MRVWYIEINLIPPFSSLLYCSIILLVFTNLLYRSISQAINNSIQYKYKTIISKHNLLLLNECLFQKQIYISSNWSSFVKGWSVAVPSKNVHRLSSNMNPNGQGSSSFLCTLAFVCIASKLIIKATTMNRQNGWIHILALYPLLMMCTL